MIISTAWGAIFLIHHMSNIVMFEFPEKHSLFSHVSVTLITFKALFIFRQFEKEMEEALQAQWEECERLKEKAIEEACTALRKQLRNKFAIEKEKAIAEALSRARVSKKTSQI